MANKVRFESIDQEHGTERNDLSKSAERLDKSLNHYDSTYKRHSDPASVSDHLLNPDRLASQHSDKSATAPKSGSNTPRKFDKTFSVALTQALLTSDTKLLHKLLSTRDTASIHDTVAELTPPLVLALLEFILTALVKSPNQLYSREGWINSILRVHNTLFARNARAKQLLVRLNKYIVGRLAINRSLLKLKGKVDGLVYMLSMSHRAGSPRSDDVVAGGVPLATPRSSGKEALVTFSVD